MIWSQTVIDPRTAILRSTAAIGVLALLLTGCGAVGERDGTGTAQAAASVENEDGDDGFPRTITSDLGEVTIEERPERILAVGGNVADIALALAGPDRMAAVPESTLDEYRSSFHDEADEVGTTYPDGAQTDPEQLAAFSPDLVIVNLVHDYEQDAAELLAQIGIPTIGFDRTPESLDDVADLVTLIGAATGEEGAATDHVADIQNRIDAVQDVGTDQETTPRVLFVSLWTDSGPYVSGPGSLNHELIGLAGAENAVDELGITEGSFLMDPEQLVAAAPTHIVTRHFDGTGLETTGGFFDQDGVAEVPAVADDRILMLPSRAFAAATGGVEGLETMAEWVHDPDASTVEVLR